MSIMFRCPINRNFFFKKLCSCIILPPCFKLRPYYSFDTSINIEIRGYSFPIAINFSNFSLRARGSVIIRLGIILCSCTRINKFGSASISVVFKRSNYIFWSNNFAGLPIRSIFINYRSSRIRSNR